MRVDNITERISPHIKSDINRVCPIRKDGRAPQKELSEEEYESLLVFIKDMASKLSEITQLLPEEILGLSRKEPTPLCRALMCECLRLRGFSYPTIGKLLGRHHATLIHGKKHLSDIKNNPTYPNENIIRIKFNNLFNTNC